MTRMYLCTVGSCLLLSSACLEERSPAPAEVVYTGDVASLLREHCGGCHSGEDAGAGYRVDSYLNILGCAEATPEQRAIDRTNDGRPLLSVLERPDHAHLLEAAERARIRRWIERGVPVRDSAVHGAGILDPRSRDWHGKLASRDDFSPLLRAEDDGACGRCHAGAPVRPRGVAHAAPGAPACTQCHAQPRGVLACGTCHGDGAARSYPPRDPCRFGSQAPDAHRAHLESDRLGPLLQCSSCHPAADASLRGTHANGTIDVVFDAAVAGADAAYDRDTGRCSVACHTRGGARAEPAFGDTEPMRCNDCHGAPPAQHYAGPCDGCHVEANEDGTALRDRKLHRNGQVDLGDGSGTCGACHGRVDDPMPVTGVHALHRYTKLAREITCGECHTVPDAATSDGHFDRGERTPAEVTFGALASARGQSPSIEGQTCREIACHGAGLAEGIERALSWVETANGGCGGCHGVPPGAGHPAADGCAAVICHGAVVTAAGEPPMLTDLGRLRHIDGVVDLRAR